MYWPCGVPQLFAHHIPDEPETADDDGGTKQQKDQQQRATRSLSLNGSNEDTKDDGPLETQSLPPSILDLKVARAEHIFATITTQILDIWSTRPTTLLTSLRRSAKSLSTYGRNVGVHFRTDASLLVIHTTTGFLLLYSLDTDVNNRVLQQRTQESQTRKQSLVRTFGTTDANGLAEVIIRFRKAIKIDAGISSVLPLDQDLLVATVKPPAIQSLQWDAQRGIHQTSTQLFSKLEWNENKSSISHMVHDRAMNLSIWLDVDGSAYAVRRPRSQTNRRVTSHDTAENGSMPAQPPQQSYDGYRFHHPTDTKTRARLAAINARFSLIALATQDGKVLCFSAKDYSGNIPLAHTFKSQSSQSASMRINALAWSPDGYCLFVGYDSGWATWSVFGKEGASSFASNAAHAETNAENWLIGIQLVNWISTGSEMLLTSPGDARIWKLDFSRSAAVGGFSCANLVRALQQTPTELAVYRGHELPDMTSISNEASLWHHAQYPLAYLHNQWPIRTAVISQDGRFIAIAGKRGLAHYSVSSGRWRVFSEFAVENSFIVRGGFCWFEHILAVGVESAQGFELRLYSRDLDLGRTPLHAESFAMPIAFIGPSGEDSLLVYTYENILYHFVMNVNERGAQLLQVGQIAFHGVVRTPSRVRSVSWILPEHQLRNGDPSRDVEHAAVLFLIDDKLVMLHPSRTPENAIKYDMRILAHQVEYYILMRDQIYFNFSEPVNESMPPTPSSGSIFGSRKSKVHYSLRDSLWIFTGETLCLWSDVQDLLQSMVGLATTKSSLLTIPVDFYPLSILLNKGVVLGIESEILQRRDVNFAQYRSLIRTQLFLPYVLRHQLLEADDTNIAFALANQYQNLSYFPHALEILLHLVLDDEAYRRRTSPSTTTSSSETAGPLPAILSFLQLALSPENYLSTIVQCVRKTEFSFWQYLFAHLPLPELMFERALALNELKTASGFLIILQTFEEAEEDYSELSASVSNDQSIAHHHRFEDQVVRLMTLAKAKDDYELCSELARFMIGIDPRGEALRRVVQKVGFRNDDAGFSKPPQARLSRRNMALQEASTSAGTSNSEDNSAGRDEDTGNESGVGGSSRIVPQLGKLDVRLTRLLAEEPKSAGAESEGVASRSSLGDYFSASPGEI